MIWNSQTDLTCSLPLRRLNGKGEPFFQEQGRFMIRRMNTPYVALVLLFILCQVIGTMCDLPDLSMAGDAAPLVEKGMACPMDGATMCPPSLTSSPERQTKNSMVLDIDHATIVLGSAARLTVPSAPTRCFWSSARSIVPISIGSSSVLRI